MVNYSDILIENVFAALADSTRRRLINQLSAGEATISALAAPLDMSLPAVMKHLKVLSDSGLVKREKRGRQVFCRLNPEPLSAAETWLNQQTRFWDESLKRLDQFLEEQQ